MALELNVSFVFQNETKGAVRYQEKLPDGTIAGATNAPGVRIGSLYIRKDAFVEGKFPTNITVSITEAAAKPKAAKAAEEKNVLGGKRAIKLK